MASQKLNVLVYTGTGTTTESVKHALFTLRRLLFPNYAVSTIGETALLKEPWAPTCALLVIPGGADLGYCRILNGPGNSNISAFVRKGGRYLGFCAGAYYGSARCEFEVGSTNGMEVVGSRELGFFPGTCRGGALKGFRYHNEGGARALRLNVNRDGFPSAKPGLAQTFRSYYNGGGVFVDAAAIKLQTVHVLAEYGDEIDVDGGSGRAAVVHMPIGNGHVLLTGPHPEFDPSQLAPQPEIAGYDKLITDLIADDEARTEFLKACLAMIGLDVAQDTAGAVPPLSSLHITSVNHQEVSELLHSLGDVVTKQDDGTELIDAEANSFRVVSGSAPTTWSFSDMKAAVDGAEGIAKRTDTLIAHEEDWPGADATPLFDFSVFYSSLLEYQRKFRDAHNWGTTVMYGEVVTSTNTILEKNPTLLSKLPPGFVFTASTQISGRGRGSNVWISPPGMLIFSAVINHAAHLATTRPIVFIQYLAAVAVAEAVQSYGKGYEEIPIRLKWPNDIYCRDPTKPADPPQYVKIGGILANCTYTDGNYHVVLGIGINTNNKRPTTSLSALAEAAGLPPFKVERLLARIVTRIEARYEAFLSRGFSTELEEAYYRHWLHSDQLVMLEAEGGVKACVKGITKDWGMLKAEELGPGNRPTGKMWTLQSDENSFDFWKGLVKRKA